MDTSKEAVERFIVGPLTEIAFSVGMPVTNEDKATIVTNVAMLRALQSDNERLRDALSYLVSACQLDLDSDWSKGTDPLSVAREALDTTS